MHMGRASVQKNNYEIQQINSNKSPFTLEIGNLYKLKYLKRK